MTQDEAQSSSTDSSFAEAAALYDRMLGPIMRHALDAARIDSGQTVIDVGCGAGGTTLEVAALVGPSGSAIGIDIDEVTIVAARARAEDLPQAQFIVADAQKHPFASGRANALVSRFGTLHFDDPRQAFTNLRSALVPDGRLAFACARDEELNLWATLPLEAAERVVGPLPRRGKGMGPFAFADEGLVRSILQDAGFHSIVLEPIDEPMWVGESLAAAVATFARTDGKKLLSRLDANAREKLFESLAASLAPYAGAEGVLLPAACWCVSARN